MNLFEQRIRPRPSKNIVKAFFEVKLSNGIVGYGECSPLPGLHDKAECKLAGAQLQAFCESKLRGRSVPTFVTSLRGQFANVRILKAAHARMRLCRCS